MCDYENCANKGTFEGNVCPGADEENQHCVDCGELWWVEKGLNCAHCEDYWCPQWTCLFVFLDCDNCGDDYGPEEGICPRCFLENPEWWCTDKDCNCDCKKDLVEEMWNEWNSHKNRDE